VLPDQAWSAGWCAAEREEALRALDAALDAPGAWRPALAAWEAGSGEAPDLDPMDTDAEPRRAALPLPPCSHCSHQAHLLFMQGA
jgi:hypothetical protein